MAMFNSELLNYQRLPSGNLAEKLKHLVFTLEHLGHELLMGALSTAMIYISLDLSKNGITKTYDYDYDPFLVKKPGFSRTNEDHD